MKNQALFSSKDESKKLKYHLLQFCLAFLRVKIVLGLSAPKLAIFYTSRQVDIGKDDLLVH